MRVDMQVDALWVAVAEALLDAFESESHVRLDSRPKYDRHAPYKVG